MSGVAVVSRQRLSDLGGAGGAGGGAGGGGGDELKHSDGPWLQAAGGAESLHTLLGPVRTELETAHEGVVTGTVGLEALAELGAVRESWQRRIEAARSECGSLAGKLRAVARAQGVTNETVKSSFARVASRAGGQ
ncbi:MULTISPECIES: hypothetical protein [unclassified Streptomyces]|uniref:hypothetical protein n=1 Tax=unclassified Streptomyces TaxID=2593676 RepID=UPI002254619C|nr:MULTISPECIES: hypothetical protein [unclassified Streptomyces]MCX4533732.1 hypothetical protein [Streptomyces sp. NBC_01669]WSA00870.1 hypothetical protein OHA79_25375 [Streptomyces sp. NBC_00841]